MMRPEWSHLSSEQQRELQRKLDVGKYLTHDKGLSDKFSRTAGTRVEIYLDRAAKRYVLHYKGKHCMPLPRGDTGNAHREVKEHFTRICRSSTRYDDKLEAIKKGAEYETREDEQLLTDVANDWADDIYIYAAKGRHSVAMNGGNKK